MVALTSAATRASLIHEYLIEEDEMGDSTAQSRLLGWRYDEQGQPIALAPDARGWLWSLELQSWLAPDETLLHLHDAQGRLQLTEAVVTQAARQEAEAARDHLETRLAALRDLLKAHNIDPNSL